MLSRLVERKTHIFCDSVHGALVDILQQTLLQSQPSVTLYGRMSPGYDHQLAQQSATHNFQDVVRILVEAGWLPATSLDIPPEQPLPVPHPAQTQTYWKSQVHLSQISPAAAMLRAFVILRVRYQRMGPQLPTVRLTAQRHAPAELDALYLLGDVFSERFNVRAQIQADDDTVTLKLVGAARLPDQGVSWDRTGYLLTRDVSVLSQPLREALDRTCRPLVVPRVWTSDDKYVWVRLPIPLQHGEHALGWLTYLQQAFGDPTSEAIDPTQIDEVGSHWRVTLAAHEGRTDHEFTALESSDTAYVLWKRPDLPDEFIHIPFRAQAHRVVSLQSPDGTEATVANAGATDVSEDGEQLVISMEPLGGACEIAANGYYYRIGHKGLLIDAGLDANRDGWQGLPALERIDQLDAMILTHAHLDHMGSLPVVLHAFPKLPVYCTRATRDILLPMFYDTVKIGQIRFKQTGEAPLLSRDMVNAINPDRFRCVEPGESYSIPEIPGLQMDVHDAGHIMGSIAVKLRLSEWDLLHTGDFSTFAQHSLKPFDTRGIKVSHVVMEGTYSGRPEFNRAERRRNLNAFIEALYQAIDEQRCVLIPSFSVGRSQEMVSLVVDALRKDPSTAGVPVYTVGMINRLNALSCTMPEFFREGYVDRIKRAEALRVDLNPRYTREDERSGRYQEAFAQITEQGPAVIISSHGMMAEGTGSFSIATAILHQDPPIDRIFLCGYMDPRTPGSRLKRRHQYPEQIPWEEGSSISRKTADACIQEFSITAHASYEELTDLALQVAQDTVTLIHGDGFALRSFAQDLQERLAAQDRQLQIHIPTNGSRVCLGTTTLPEEWDVSAPSEVTEVAPAPAGSSLAHRGTRLRVSPLVREFGNAWLVIPVGQDSTELTIEHDVDFARVLYIEASRDNLDTYQETWNLYDAYEDIEEQESTETDLTARPSEQRAEVFSWDVLDEIELFIEVEGAYGQVEQTTFDFSVVAEIRPQRHALDAQWPVLRLKIGGSERPELERLVEVDERYRQKRKWEWQDVAWDPVRRELEVVLQNQGEIGRIERLQVWLRWPSGYLQKGPAIGPFALNPQVMVETAGHAIRVGETHRITMLNFPPPGIVRLEYGDAQMTGVSTLQIRPTRAGHQALTCLYRDRHNDLIRWPAATLNVLPGASVRCPETARVGQSFAIKVTGLEIEGVADTLRLQHNDKTVATVAVSKLPWQWEATCQTPGPHTFRLLAQDAKEAELVLWSGDIEVFPHPLFDWDASCCATTTDGTQRARLVWDSTEPWLRSLLEQACEQQGFRQTSWQGNTLFVEGNAETLGVRYLDIAHESYRLSIPVVTLPPLQLLQEGGGAATTTATPGAKFRFGTLDGPLPNAWFRIESGTALQEGLDRPLLRMAAERIHPFFDDQSCNLRESSATLLYPGRYRISLYAGPDEIHHAQIDVEPQEEQPPSRPRRRLARPKTLECHHEDTFLSSLARSIATSDTPHPHAMLAHWTADRHLSYELIVVESSALVEVLWERLRQEREQGKPVAVLYPGHALPRAGGELLARTLKHEQERVAHLIHPTPWGEVVNNLAQARALRKLGVHCALPEHSTIITQDHYPCLSCNQLAHWRTDAKQVYLVCPLCRHQVPPSQLTLTLEGLRHQGADVLFAPYETAHYLWFGAGQRYLAGFANMPTMSIPFCHSPEERRVVSHHLANLSAQYSLQQTSDNKLDRVVLAAATELGWNHPAEIQELYDLASLALTMWRRHDHTAPEVTLWQQLYDDILTTEILQTNQPASLLVLQLERLWEPTSFGRVRPMQEGIDGVLQWLALLR